MSEALLNEPATHDAGTHAAAAPLVVLSAMPEDARKHLHATIRQTGVPVRLRTPDPITLEEQEEGELATYTPATQLGDGWVLGDGDYLAAAALLAEVGGEAVLLLGPESETLPVETLHTWLVAATRPSADLILPRYDIGVHSGLVNAAILYPLTSALYGVDARFPLPLDVILSARMASRLSALPKSPGYSSTLLWPVAEALAGKLTVKQVAAGARELPSPPASDLQTALSTVVGALFADTERKAAVWQRIRSEAHDVADGAAALPTGDVTDEITSLVSNFSNAYQNLHEIWSLVLPPQSMLQLKRLSQTPAAAFFMPNALWARVVYDVLLGWRLRTINQGHLLGAMTPLYLAWVASHLLHSGGDPASAERHIHSVAQTFAAEKPYLVARWRWPDRFNP